MRCSSWCPETLHRVNYDRSSVSNNGGCPATTQHRHDKGTKHWTWKHLANCRVPHHREEHPSCAVGPSRPRPFFTRAPGHFMGLESRAHVCSWQLCRGQAAHRPQHARSEKEGTRQMARGQAGGTTPCGQSTQTSLCCLLHTVSGDTWGERVWPQRQASRIDQGC